jgi:hypothetical protein
LVEYCALCATGITHDVKNSNTSKNGAATELLQLMTLLFVETHNRKTVKFFCYHAMLNDLQKYNPIVLCMAILRCSLAVFYRIFLQ